MAGRRWLFRSPMYRPGMRDGDVRAALHEELRAEHVDALDKTRFVDELGLCGEVRVDVAVLNGALSGFELKSERDNLRRLPAQVETYSRVLDYATLVVAENHVKHARDVVRPWWGLYVAVPAGGHVVLEHEREPRYNELVDAGSLVQLLWRDETLSVLVALGHATGLRSKPRRVLWERLVAVVELQDLRDLVRERLKSRAGWRAAP